MLHPSTEERKEENPIVEARLDAQFVVSVA